MKEAFFKQEIIVTALGIFLCIVLIEFGLCMGGALYSSLQERGNRLSAKKNGTYRIMCLGESVTAGVSSSNYPALLEKILNQKNIGIEFSVINKGVIGSDTNFILLHLAENIDKYKPDMVITMMGCNDSKVLYYKDIPDVNYAFLKHLRIYRFLRSIWVNIRDKIRDSKDKNALPRELAYDSLDIIQGKKRNTGWDRSILKENNRLNNKESWIKENYSRIEDKLKKAIELNPDNVDAYIELGKFYYEKLEYVHAKDVLTKALKLNTHNGMPYYILGLIYARLIYTTGEDYVQAEDALKKAIELKPENLGAYIVLSRIYVYKEDFNKAEGTLKRGIKSNPDSIYLYYAYFSLGELYWCRKDFVLAETMFKKSIELNLRESNSLYALANLYKENDKHELAEKYYEKANELNSQYYYSETFYNYRRLKNILDEKNIQLVCAQYPLRSIKPLMEIFKGNTGVIFVDNEKIFKEVVEKEGYREYFTDIFAGDFGHCTLEGYRLLAENVVNVILNKLFR